MRRTYTITELSSEFGVTLRTIRFYEEQGMLSPARQGRSRVYAARDRVRLKLILRGKRLGLSLSEIAEIIDLYEVARDESSQALTLLNKLSTRKKQLIQQREDIEQVMHDIEQLEQYCHSVLQPPGLRADCA
ncbi:MerR family transcriptional regulator [Rivihabitans pingtungensis]|jgi:DNA-binding transcriptional MerR regulator|uniref:MerR family transcriptional regulator n=1 Tax=Rivihabitans pingtungensis TaxID=1054498 RepID=UPI002356283C|nr:MerR family DNA-binding transcriptional regulator [Rivihabitans pingtungensis]MCK6437331.1 MerR family DNA-binding transcriptional regulator [Rivihabitans pingtungensis]